MQQIIIQLSLRLFFFFKTHAHTHTRTHTHKTTQNYKQTPKLQTPKLYFYLVIYLFICLFGFWGDLGLFFFCLFVCLFVCLLVVFFVCFLFAWLLFICLFVYLFILLTNALSRYLFTLNTLETKYPLDKGWSQTVWASAGSLHHWDALCPSPLILSCIWIHRSVCYTTNHDSYFLHSKPLFSFS